MAELRYPDPPLTDGTVLLRPWHPADARQRFEAFSDELCQRFSSPRLEPTTEPEVAAAFARNEQERLAGTALNLAIVPADDPERIWGAASVYDVDPVHARAAVGYWLAPWARGRGAATRTVRLLASWTFGTLAVQRLELTCAPDNAASIRVAERCGFTREGVLRSHLRFKETRRDTVMFSLLPSDSAR
ncbi:GNAT family N-acetyltransferase [Dactylosporangium sp. CA-139066]|uniref:GNAT family N-acetyltransferase n=1 Tax=Dactylosporangium sp. CA-139066 TaxID=3239930 RepID=UPI003D8A1AFC